MGLAREPLDAAESMCDLVFSCPMFVREPDQSTKKRGDFCAPLFLFLLCRSMLSVHSPVGSASTTTVESPATTMGSAGFVESTCGTAMHCGSLRQSS